MFLSHTNTDIINLNVLYRKCAYLSSFYDLQSFSEDEEEEIENIPPYNFIMRGFPANYVGSVVDDFRRYFYYGSDFYDIWSRIREIIYCEEDIDLFITIYKDMLIRFKKKRPFLQGLIGMFKYQLNVFRKMPERIYGFY